jgi:sugar lactone lactonase YvrE
VSLRIRLALIVFSVSTLPSAVSATVIEDATVAGDSIVVYEDMSSQSTEVKTLSQGQSVFVTFSIVGSDGEWCSIRESAEAGVIGWVRCSELDRQVVEKPSTVTARSSQVSSPVKRAIGTSVAANTIVTAAGTGPRAGNATLRALEAQIWQDMQRGKVNPADIERLKREQQKAFLEAGGSPGDVEALKRAAMRDLTTGGNESARALEMTVAKMMVVNQLKPVGDGGPALLAQLRNPAGMTFDRGGNLYIADSDNRRVRKVTPDGIISTVAGIGVPGHSGDGESALTAQMSRPRDVAVDASGTTYIADAAGNSIRMVLPDGTIWTLVGDGSQGFSGDGGPSHLAQLSKPEAIELDDSGNLYVADSGNNRVRMVARNRDITTIVGDGTRGYAGDGGPATSAKLFAPIDLAFDNDKNLYIVDAGNYCIRKLTPEGIITTVFGAGQNRSDAAGDQSDLTRLRRPTGITLDGGNNLYVVDSFQFRVLRVTPEGRIDIIAGGENADSGDGGPAHQAGLAEPQRVVVDSEGNLFISTYGDRIRKVGRVAVGRQ